MKIPIDNVIDVQVEETVVRVTYKDGTKLMTKGSLHLVSDYKNDSDIPLNDHCV